MTDSPDPRALLISRSESLRHTMRTMLEDRSVEVHEVVDPADAGPALRDLKPSVAILHMPDSTSMDQIVRDLRDTESGARLPIILCAPERTDDVLALADRHDLSLLVTGDEDQICAGAVGAAQFFAHRPFHEPQNKKILVVDDSPAVQVLTRRIFEREGYDVLVCERVHEAMEHVTDGEAFIAVLIDLNLPDGTGFDVLRALRKNSSVPAFVISGMRQAEQVDRALALGATDFIEKPFHPRELLARIERHL